MKSTLHSRHFTLLRYHSQKVGPVPVACLSYASTNILQGMWRGWQAILHIFCVWLIKYMRFQVHIDWIWRHPREKFHANSRLEKFWLQWNDKHSRCWWTHNSCMHHDEKIWLCCDLLKYHETFLNFYHPRKVWVSTRVISVIWNLAPSVSASQHQGHCLHLIFSTLWNCGSAPGLPTFSNIFHLREVTVSSRAAKFVLFFPS